MTDQELRDGAARIAATAASWKQARRRVIQAEDELKKAKDSEINAKRGYEIAEEEFAELMKEDE